MMQAYRKLKVWDKAMELVDSIYKLTKSFPSDERFGLTSQLRRAAVSIPSNIAEGSQRNSKNEFRQFISIAYASLAEVETQCEIALRQEYISQAEMDVIFTISAELGKMLNGLSNSLLPTAN